MSVLLISKDLFFAPIVRSAAEQFDATLVVGLNPDSQKVIDLPADSIAVCIVDLSGIGSSDVAQTAQDLSGRFPAARLVAFAPHVHAAKLKAASESGFDPVLSRGQVSSVLPQLFGDWLGATDT
ncbi:MAG: hypothetical protein Aurels2KO_38600 [Aureliella sp.]